MSEEETKVPETSEQPTDKPVTLDDLMETVPVETPGQKPKKEEPKKEESEKQSKSENEEEKVASEPKDESEDEPKKEEETTTEETELTGEQKEWRESHENKKKWQGELTRKSQLVNQIEDEEIRSIQAELKLRKELEDVKPEPLPDYLEYEVGRDEVTDEPIIYKLPTGELQKIVDREVNKAKEAWTKEMGPVLAKGEQAVQDAEGYRKDAEANTALMGINRYFDDHPDAKIDLGKDPIQTLNDIESAGDTHPDFDKLLNLKMVSDRSSAKGISMSQAHTEIFGKSEQTKKAKDKLRSEQEIALEEKPGQTPKTPTVDEEFEKQIGISGKSKANVFD